MSRLPRRRGPATAWTRGAAAAHQQDRKAPQNSILSTASLILPDHGAADAVAVVGLVVVHRRDGSPRHEGHEQWEYLVFLEGGPWLTPGRRVHR